MRRRIVIATVASEDLAGIVTYVAATAGTVRALALDAQLDRAIRSLDRVADRGRVVPELQRRGIAAYREIQRPPYRIIYRVARAEVWILAVVDGRRDLDELLFDRVRRDVTG